MNESKIIETGGAGFPRTHNEDIDGNGSQNGMTFRDYFASHASKEDIDIYLYPDPRLRVRPEMSREQAKYAYADAMLKVREN